MKTARIILPVEYDEKVTDAESIAYAVDKLLETALSTPGIMDEYGNPNFQETELTPWEAS